MYICQVLANKPFSLPIDYIGSLTPYQIKTLYLCDRDKDGQIVPPSDGPLKWLTPSERLAIFKETNKLKDYQVAKILSTMPTVTKPLVTNRPEGYIPDGQVLRLPWDERPQ